MYATSNLRLPILNINEPWYYLLIAAIEVRGESYDYILDKSGNIKHPILSKSFYIQSKK